MILNVYIGIDRHLIFSKPRSNQEVSGAESPITEGPV
jgi:hypothetical protein